MATKLYRSKDEVLYKCPAFSNSTTRAETEKHFKYTSRTMLA
jgi:hypothetical protein